MAPDSAAAEKNQYHIVKTKFNSVFKETWTLYKKHFFGFIALFLIPLIVNVALQILPTLLFIPAAIQGALPAGGFVIIVTVIFGIIGWFVQLIGTNSVIRGAYLADRGKLNVGEALATGFKKLGKAVGLSIRAFFYTGAWVLVILFALAMGAAGLSALDLGGGVIGMQNLGIFQGILQVIAPLSIVFWVLLLIAIFIAVKRFCNAAFAFPILLSGEDISSRDALKKSIELADGLTGVIFSNYFWLSLLLALVSGVLTQLCMQIIMAILPPQKDALVLTYYTANVTYAAFLPGLLISTFANVFQYAFMKKAIEEKSDQAPSA